MELVLYEGIIETKQGTAGQPCLEAGHGIFLYTFSMCPGTPSALILHYFSIKMFKIRRKLHKTLQRYLKSAKIRQKYAKSAKNQQKFIVTPKKIETWCPGTPIDGTRMVSRDTHLCPGVPHLVSYVDLLNINIDQLKRAFYKNMITD